MRWRAWRPYLEASLRLEARLDEDLRAHAGLTLIDYHMLLLLVETSERRLRMSELADRMAFSRSRITYQVNSMAKRGLVVREPVPDDGRGYRAVLTATGLETLRRATPVHIASVRELFFGTSTTMNCLVSNVFSPDYAIVWNATRESPPDDDLWGLE